MGYQPKHNKLIKIQWETYGEMTDNVIVFQCFKVIKVLTLISIKCRKKSIILK